MRVIQEVFQTQGAKPLYVVLKLERSLCFELAKELHPHLLTRWGFRKIPKGGNVSHQGKGKRKNLSKLREATIALTHNPSSAEKDKLEERTSSCQ